MGNSIFDGRGRGAVLDTRGTVVHQVKANNSGRLASLLGDPVGPGDFLLAGEDVLAVNAAKVVVELDGTGIGVGVGQGRVDVVRGTGLRGSEGDAVNEEPSPVSDNVDCQARNTSPYPRYLPVICPLVIFGYF